MSFAALVGKIAEDPQSPAFATFRQLYNVGRIISIFDAALNYLSTTLGNVQYMGPVRTRNERYYRYQDLSVSEIDPDARNFPVFLNSLSASQIERFSSWARAIFGYGVKVARREGI